MNLGDCEYRWSTSWPVERRHRCDREKTHVGEHQCFCGEKPEPSDLDCPACGHDPMAPHNGKGVCPPKPDEQEQS